MGTKVKKFFTVPLMALTFAASGLGFQVNNTEAALSAVGPVDPATTFPFSYQDATGLQLANMAVGDAFGIADAAEGFWWSAEASLIQGSVDALLVLALESTPTAPTAVFQRIRIRVSGLQANQSYVIKHPYGTVNMTADGGGLINETQDIGCFNDPAEGGPLCDAAGFNIALAKGANNAPLGGTVGPFLTWNTFSPIPAFQDPALVNPANPTGIYVGKTGVPHVVTGGTNGNVFSVVGPGVNITQPLFDVTGKLFAPFAKEVTPIANRVPTNSNTYRFSSNEAGAITVGGSCTVAPASAVVGSNTITLTTTTPANSTGLHSNCTVKVTNAQAIASNVIAITPFTVDTRPPFISAINVAPVADVVKVGTTKQLSASATDQFGNAITSEAMTWSSSNTAVGTVDASGVFTAVGTGSTTITAKNATGTVVATTTVNANTLVISDIRVINKKKDRVTITWTTTVPSTDLVKFSKTKKGSKLVSTRTALGGANTTTHTATLTRLKKNTKYFFQITGTDGVTTVKSPIKSFTTRNK